jgi:hypothetical protein
VQERGNDARLDGTVIDLKEEGGVQRAETTKTKG